MNYHNIAIGCFVAAGVFFVISLILFFYLDIVRVISDLTGHTAKREIENIRSKNSKTGRKTFKSSNVNVERGKVTDRINTAGHVVEAREGAGANLGTTKIRDNGAQNTGYEVTSLLQDDIDSTSLLEENTADQTSLLQQNGTDVLNNYYEPAQNETSILSYPDIAMTGAASVSPYGGAANQNETSVLSQNDEPQQNQTTVLNGYDTSLLELGAVFPVKAALLQEIKFIHSSEIIS